MNKLVFVTLFVGLAMAAVVVASDLDDEISNMVSEVFEEVDQQPDEVHAAPPRTLNPSLGSGCAGVSRVRALACGTPRRAAVSRSVVVTAGPPACAPGARPPAAAFSFESADALRLVPPRPVLVVVRPRVPSPLALAATADG